MIKCPCDVCGVTIRVVSLDTRYCGPACEALHVRRKNAEAADLPHTHPDQHPITPEQEALHRRGLRKRGLA
ncbi:MAG: hypothetical protein WD795_16990 [Woeseia sp.]